MIVSLIAKGTHSSFELSWSMWAIAALVTWAVFAARDAAGHLPAVSAGGEKHPDAPRFAREKLQALGPVTLPEKITLGVFALLLILWAGIPAMISARRWRSIPPPRRLIGLAVLLATGVLSWEDVLKHKGPGTPWCGSRRW